MRGEVLGVERRRRWNDDDKLAIVSSVGIDGATVTHVAHRHDVTRQQIYRWQLELALEDLLVAVAEAEDAPLDEDEATAPSPAAPDQSKNKPRRRPRVSDTTPRERRELDPGSCCPDCGGDAYAGFSPSVPCELKLVLPARQALSEPARALVDIARSVMSRVQMSVNL